MTPTENIGSCNENTIGKLNSKLKPAYSFADFSELSTEAINDKNKLNNESIKNISDYRKEIFKELLKNGITINNNREIESVGKYLKEFGFGNDKTIDFMKSQLVKWKESFNVTLTDNGKIEIKTLSFLSGEFDNTNDVVEVFDKKYTKANGLNLSCDKSKDPESLEIKVKAIKEFNDLYSKLGVKGDEEEKRINSEIGWKIKSIDRSTPEFEKTWLGSKSIEAYLLNVKAMKDNKYEQNVHTYSIALLIDNSFIIKETVGEEKGHTDKDGKNKVPDKSKVKIIESSTKATYKQAFEFISKMQADYKNYI